MLSALLVMIAVATNLRLGYQADFVSFWAAGRLAIAGAPAAAYAIDAHKAVELSAVALDGLMPFPYPPPYLAVVLPFGLLSYALAHATWVAATGWGYVTAAQRLMPGSVPAAIAFPPVIICGIIGQNSFLLAAIFMAALTQLARRPLVAGMIFGLLVFKPHLGLVIPLALIAGREWRAFAGAAISATGLTAISVVLFGLASWQGFFALLPLYGHIAADGLVSWNKMASVYAGLRLIGVPALTAWTIHIVIACGASAVTWKIWRGSVDPLERGAALAVATLLISPYIYIYDQMLIFAAIAWLLREGGRPYVLASIYGLSLVSLAGNFHAAATINLAPVVTLVALLALARPTVRIGNMHPVQLPIG